MAKGAFSVSKDPETDVTWWWKSLSNDTEFEFNDWTLTSNHYDITNWHYTLNILGLIWNPISWIVLIS